jgi:hypothetical protein
MLIPRPPNFGPPRLRRILGDIRTGILAAQPRDGQNITTQETPGGTIINADRGIVCPDEVTVDISGITLNCGCIAGAGGTSYRFTDIDDLNGSFTLSDPESFVGGNCLWRIDPGTYFQIESFDENDSCDGSPSSTDTNPVTEVVVGYVNGTWHALVWSFVIGTGLGGFLLLFYGSADSLEEISNSISCSENDGVTLDNDFITLFYGGPFTATVICGPSCPPGVALHFNGSGTWIFGPCDGLICVPNGICDGDDPIQCPVLSFDSPSGVILDIDPLSCTADTSGSVSTDGTNNCFSCVDPASSCGYTWEYSFSGGPLSWSVSGSLIIACGECNLTLSVSGSGSGDDSVTALYDNCDSTININASVTFI